MNSWLFSAEDPKGKGLLALQRLGLVISIAAAGLLLLLRGAPDANGASDFAPLPSQPAVTLTNPIILVSPAKLDLGSVAVGKSVTATFLVQNVGHGKLVGTAKVASPFEIVSGGKYALTDKEIQVVTVAYTPRRGGADAATVTFTGAAGANARVTGKAVAKQE
jgi:hypothetical protein